MTQVLLKKSDKDIFCDDLNLDEYDFLLDEKNVAQNPEKPAHNAKMLIYNKSTNKILNKKFIDLSKILNKNDVLFFNDTKVYKARVILKKKEIINNAGIVKFVEKGEFFVYNIIDSYLFECLVSDDKNFKPGNKILFDEKNNFIIKNYTNSGMMFEIVGNTIENFLKKNGQMPIPPYIKYEKEKENEYQTIFAKTKGSVASPTASLHFSKKLMEDLKHIKKEYLTLHIGLGTFKPLYHKNINKNKLHKEKIHININMFEKIFNIKNKDENIIAVGTTVARTLESICYLWIQIKKRGDENVFVKNKQVIEFWNKKVEKIEQTNNNYVLGYTQKLNKIIFETDIFIYPGYKRKIVDELITNFHLPKSSLLIMVSSFVTRSKILDIYKYAIEKGYKFYSFGDGMWLKKS